MIKILMFIDNKIFINNCKITKLKIDIKLDRWWISKINCIKYYQIKLINRIKVEPNIYDL